MYVNVENGKTEWCVASVNLDKDGMPDKRGPTMYVTTHNLKINNQVIEKLRIEGGGSFTDIALEEVNKAYKNSFGSEPKSLQISLAESNLANFKREFARYKKQKPSASDDEAAQHSIRQISAGKKRFDHGYTNFRIELSGWSEENLGRDVGLSRVPAKVDVIAEKP